MLPRTFDANDSILRVLEARDRLKGRIWNVVDLPVSIEAGQISDEPVPCEEAFGAKFTPVGELPVFWGKPFQYRFWKVSWPVAECGSPLYLRWNDQAEATVYHKRKPWAGFDPGHKEVILPQGVSSVFIESMCARTAIWVPGERQGLDPLGSRLNGAELLHRNDDQWHAFYDMDVLVRLVEMEYKRYIPDGRFDLSFGHRPAIQKISPLFRQLLYRMDVALDDLDRGDMIIFRRKLAEIYAEFSADKMALRCKLTGHAHIDLVWMWPESVGEFKAAHTFATTCRLMELYPEFIFGYSQPASYDAVGRRHPGLLDEVNGYIKDQRWEATGAMDVEADTQLPCGEALARNFVMGQKRFKEITGMHSRVLWLPDVFGYSPCVPQIMRGCGVDYFFTTKMNWSRTTSFPHSSFRWRGHDNSEVIAHIQQVHSYNTAVEPDLIRTLSESSQQAGMHDAFLMPVGYGDGGGGVTAEMCERARRMADLSGVPKTSWGRIDEFFDELAERHAQLPIYQGEMYLEYHRSVHTTHGNLKSAFRAAERGLQVWEAVHCAMGLGSVDEHCWRRVIFAQFHDYIPGSSIKRVYDKGIPELNGIADASISNAGKCLEVDEGDLSIFNPLPLVRREWIDSGDGSAVFAELPPLTGGPIAKPKSSADLPIRKLPPPAGVFSSENSLCNEYVHACFDEDGRITSLEVDGSAIAVASPLNALHLFPDYPHNFHAWDIDRVTLSNSCLLRAAKGAAAFSGNGTHRGMIRFQMEAGANTVVVHYILEAGSRVLRVKLDVNWREKNQLLKAVFPTDYHPRGARYGTPFGSVVRSQQPGYPKDEAQFEVPGSRWACLADETESEGIAIVTKDKYGFGCYDGTLHLSLLRSALVTRSGNPGEVEVFSDMGPATIEYGITSFCANAVREQQPAVLADTLYTPPVQYSGNAVESGFMGLVGGDSLVPCWCKPCEQGEGWVLRMHETMGRRGTAKILLRDGWNATRVDLMDEPGGDKLENGCIHFLPYQLLSYRIGPA